MDRAKPERDLEGRAKAAAEVCPYCGKPIVKRSEDHIFPQFMGGKRTIVCCKTCNEKFGFRFEAQASRWFQRLHFYLATQGLRLKVPMVRWKGAFEQDGLLYDAIFEDGEAKFTLARPIISIDRDRGILNAKFGSDRQARPVINSLLKKYGVTAKPDLDIMPTLMPKPRSAVAQSCCDLPSKCALRSPASYPSSLRTSCIARQGEPDGLSAM